MSYSILRQVRIAFLVLAFFAMLTGLAPKAFAAAVPSDFHSVSVCRLLDTRLTGTPLARDADGNATPESLVIPVVGMCGIPVEAEAVALNVTVIDPVGVGQLTLNPVGQPVSPAMEAAVHFAGPANRNFARSVQLLLGTDGEVEAQIWTSIPNTAVFAHLVIDIVGYYAVATPVADAASVTEDDPATTIDVLANDINPNGDTLSVSAVTQPANGSVVITNSGADLSYQPNADYCNTPPGTTLDTFDYTLSPSGRTTTVTVTVTCKNDAPAGTDNTVSTSENTDYVFTTADFGFTDPNDTPANALLAVTITTLPSVGSLTLSGGAVSAGQSIPVADITAGNLKFTPAANGSGTPYASFTFQVQDDGGTANGGVDLDPTPNTLSVDVTGVNNEPAGTDGAVVTPEDVQYTFAAADFGFTDPLDNPTPDDLASVVITTLPGLGSLTLSGGGVAAGQEIAVADINAGNLKFSPAANASGSPYTTFTFQVRDDGGTAGGGVDLDASANTLTINVTPVNDAPAGADNTVATAEDTQYTFTAADFGFTDPNDTPANALQAVKITTLPALGSLTLSGSGFAAGTDISVADITAGNLKFTPAANGSGSPYTTFTFQVRDDGGTAGGGVDLDPTPNAMTINVTANNDAPAGTDNTVSTPEDTQHTFIAADFGFTDPNDTPANNFASVVITTLPVLGSLTLSGGGVVAGQEVTIADVNAGNLKFQPAANGSGSPYTSFTFQVRDDGGVAGGGVDLDPTPNTMTVNVTAVNDAPAGTNNTVVAFEDAQYTFTAADFGFTDPIDIPANALASVVITTLPGLGSLTLSGGGVVTGQEIPVASINAGNLKFAPSANGSGSPYTSFTFQVRDDGGTAGGGVDLDPTPNTITVNVTPVNDAPAGTDNAVTTPEDVQYTFTAADFGFTDPNDSPANTLASVVIASLPGAGSLTLSGSGFVAGTEISVANITAGNLKFVGAANAFGSPYASFTFQVRDDGGTANGGVNLDPTPNTMVINVTPVNDAPTVLNESFDVLGNTELRVDLAAGTTPHASETTTGPSSYKGVLDNDGDVEGDVVKITAIGSGCADITAPFDCTLSDGAVVHVEENGEFSYTPGPGDTSGSFAYTVTDVPAFGTPLSAGGTVTFNHSSMVWWVDPTAGGGGNGTSVLPFNVLTPLNGAGGAGDSDSPGNYIFIHDGTLAGSIEMEANQHLIGQGNVNTGPAAGFALSIPVNLNGNGSPTNLVATGTHPQLTNASGNTVTAGNAIPLEIAGLSLAGGTIAGGGACGSPTFACNAIDLTSTGAITGSLAIANNEFRGAGAEGIDVNLNAGTTGTLTLNVTNNSWNLAGTHTGNAVDINRAAGTLNLNFSGNAGIKSNNVAGAAVLINGGAVASTTITGFSSNSVSGDTLGAGVVISNATFDSNLGTGGFQQVDGDNLIIGDSVNVVGGAGMSVTTAQGNLRFDVLGVYAGTSGLTLSGTGGGMTFGVAPAIPSGTSVIRASNGAAVDINTATVDLQLADMDSTTSGSGVSLTSAGGTFSTDSDASISKTNGGGTAFAVASSSVTVTYAGTLNVTSGSGVSLTSNSGSMSFSGGMTLSTGANAGFTATGGGTVTVTDPPGLTNNTITTTSGTALTVANTTIGVSGLTFESVSAGTSGTPANGIFLDSTGSTGTFTVTGGTNTSVGGDSSGGVIKNATGATGGTSGVGVYVKNARATLRRMHIHDSDNYGIFGTGTTTFTLEYSTIDSTETATSVNGDSASADDEEGSVAFEEWAGTGVINSSIIGDGFSNNLRVLNTNGADLDRLTVSNSTFNNNGLSGNNNIHIESRNSGTTLNFTLQGSTIKGARADWINASNNSLSTMDLVISGNAFSNLAPNAHAAAAAGGNRVVLGSVGTLSYDILNNTLQGAKGEAIRVRSTATVASGIAGTANGTISGNDIGLAGTANSGSSEGSGIFLFTDGGADHTALVTGNEVYQYNNHGIRVDVGDEQVGTSVVNITVTNNTVDSPGNLLSDFNGIHLNHGTVAATDDFTSCIDIRLNDVTGSGNGAVYPNNAEIRLRQRQTTTVVLPGYTGLNNEDCNVIAFVAGQNTVNNSGAGSCTNGTPNPPTKNAAATTQGATTTTRGFESGSACIQPN